MKIKSILKEMRVHHYIKNFLIFTPLFFGMEFFFTEKLFFCIMGFIAFSILSSTVYIINDIFDAEKDRLHPIKCKRPIASGEISKKQAIGLTIFLYAIGFALLIYLRTILAILVVCVYLVLNIAYSFKLKNIPIVDIVILSSGFVLRVLLGSVLTGVEISTWLYLVVISTSLCFALGKRRGEIKNTSTETRKVLAFYTEKFLDKNMYSCMTLINTFYALWAMDTAQQKNLKLLIWTFPIVLLITMKYSYDVENESDGDPVEVLFDDKWLLLLCTLYVVLIVFILYFRNF